MWLWLSFDSYRADWPSRGWCPRALTWFLPRLIWHGPYSSLSWMYITKANDKKSVFSLSSILLNPLLKASSWKEFEFVSSFFWMVSALQNLETDAYYTYLTSGWVSEDWRVTCGVTFKNVTLLIRLHSWTVFFGIFRPCKKFGAGVAWSNDGE